MSVILSIVDASGQKKSGQEKSRQASSPSLSGGKLRGRRASAKSPGETVPTTTHQSPVSNIVESHKKESEAKAGEEPDQPGDTQGSLDPAPGSSERPAIAEPRAPGSDAKEANVSPDRVQSLRDQIEAVADGAERIRLQLKLSEQLVAAGKKPEAIEELRSIINANAFDPQSFYNAGNALARLGDSAEAIKAYRKAIDQRKGNYSRALNNLGVILLREGRWEESHTALLSALKLESFRYAEASYNLGRLYSARGEIDLATREWRRTLTIEPEHRAAAQALSLGASGAGVVVRAEASAEGRSVNRDIRNREASVGNNTARSVKSLASDDPVSTKSAVIDPVSYDLLQRARNLAELGKLGESVGNYQRLLSRMHGYFPPANLELSYALMNLNKFDDAFANLLKVADRDGPQYPITYYYLGRLYERKGNLTLAEESFAKAAIAFTTKNNSLLLDLSRVRERQGNFKGALAAMEEYVTLMEQQGMKPTWSDESLSVLRQKVRSESK
ncbi:MAG TPA: tetratricopeptide repeat protein [Pyrinomonadaceae bacterium]|nr:tetratricopeptide repeat protein [Pyrinomonadaceae bacterium]